MHDLARAFASRINKVCKLKKTPKTFRHLVPLDTQELRLHLYIRGFYEYALRQNLIIICPFLTIQILNPFPAEF